jgi:hypothetical protein
MELKLPNDCLAVFADDTGHETLVEGQPVYGLGGCAVLAQNLDAVIQSPWREIRRLVTGSPDTPLHASDFGPSVTKDDILMVADFFQRGRFARLGAIVSVETAFADELSAIETVAMVLNKRISDIARWTRFRSVAVIFESSERADPLIEKAFQNIVFEEDGNQLHGSVLGRAERDGYRKSLIRTAVPAGFRACSYLNGMLFGLISPQYLDICLQFIGHLPFPRFTYGLT